MSRAEFAARCKTCDPRKNPQEALDLLREAAKLAEQVDELKSKLTERKKAAESEKLRKAAEVIDRLIAMDKAAELAEQVLLQAASQTSVKTAPKKSKPKSKEPRKKYGEFKHVQLTDTEYGRLVSDFGENVATEYIKTCDEYCEQHGKTYKNYYLAVRNFINGDMKKKKGAFAPKEDAKDDSHAHSYDLQKLLEHAMNNPPKVREE